MFHIQNNTFSIIAFQFTHLIAIFIKTDDSHLFEKQRVEKNQNIFECIQFFQFFAIFNVFYLFEQIYWIVSFK
jgi:hypothetical protein